MPADTRETCVTWALRNDKEKKQADAGAEDN